MKKLLFIIAITGFTQTACKKSGGADAAKTTQSASPTLAYEGAISETPWGDTNVPVTLTLDKATSTFIMTVDYDNTRTRDGQPVEDLNDAGTFTKVKDPKWGDVFELSGEITGTKLYQIASKTLLEISSDRATYTGLQLELQ